MFPHKIYITIPNIPKSVSSFTICLSFQMNKKVFYAHSWRLKMILLNCHVFHGKFYAYYHHVHVYFWLMYNKFCMTLTVSSKTLGWIHLRCYWVYSDRFNSIRKACQCTTYKTYFLNIFFCALDKYPYTWLIGISHFWIKNPFQVNL